ncbi:MAG: ammonium transporter [Cyanobacteria bacterium]|nr:ammonium transporter [Cyanobacteriota bacterium]
MARTYAFPRGSLSGNLVRVVHPEFNIDRRKFLAEAGDVAWVMASSSLVMLMTPALGMFYGGMVDRRNLLNTMMMTFIVQIAITLQWVIVGYSLCFAPGFFHCIGNFSYLGLEGVGASPNKAYSETLPQIVFMLFQMKFAVITPALIIGAVVERVRFKVFLMFSILWSFLVYDPIAHWIWGVDGWLHKLGALDFAGGTVIHITAGTAALALAIALNQRVSTNEAKPRQSLLITLIGTFLLWFGWFGFNGGSALSAGYLSAQALVTSSVAASAGALTWLLLEIRRGETDFIGVAIGSIVGLVAITPACGYVHVLPAIVIGAAGAALAFWTMGFVKGLGIDDRLDVFASHGVAGAWGAIATGIFADAAINPAGANGVWLGNWNLLGVQLLSVLVVASYTFVVSFLLAKILQCTVGFSLVDSSVVGIDSEDELNAIGRGELVGSNTGSDDGKKYRRQYRPLWTEAHKKVD